jgi:hypothetical protein
MPSFQNRELLAESQIFKKQIMARAHTASQNSEEESQLSGHGPVVSGETMCKSGENRPPHIAANNCKYAQNGIA